MQRTKNSYLPGLIVDEGIKNYQAKTRELRNVCQRLRVGYGRTATAKTLVGAESAVRIERCVGKVCRRRLALSAEHPELFSGHRQFARKAGLPETRFPLVTLKREP